MADDTLSPFHIRNLGSSSKSPNSEDNLVRISAPVYDKTVSANPAATLRYKDEENDTITLGSSRELMDKLAEPTSQPSKTSSRKGKDRMSIAMLLSEAQQNPEALKYHVFDIDEREEIKKLWQELQQKNKNLPPKTVGPNISGLENWSPAEDSMLVQLRESGMDWTTISKKIGFRTEVACRLQYQNLKQKRFVVVYERSKEAMWTPIASELGISWKEAESLHWELGKDAISRIAQRLNVENKGLEGNMLSVRSFKKAKENDHEPKMEPFDASKSIPKFEDYRAHHFNATMPPQLQPHPPSSQAFKAFSSRMKSARSSLRSLDGNSKANLTVEGKRQAQAAGDILRARTAPSRHRKAAMINGSGRPMLQNRWADYTSSDTPFSPKTVQDMASPSGRPSLSSEGKRQAQAAGDKLRCRTNPIRHSRPSRSASLEHGVNKNRWSSYVTPRNARSGDGQPNDTEPVVNSHPERIEIREADKQPTLLEVFEAELAKDSGNAKDEATNADFPDPEISAIPSEPIDKTAPQQTSNESQESKKDATSRQQPNDLFGGIKMIGDLLQSSGDVDGLQEISQAVDQGLRSAAGGFDVLMRGLTEGLQEFTNRTQQAPGHTRDFDSQSFDDTIKGLRDIVSSFTSGFNVQEKDIQKDVDESIKPTSSEPTSSQPSDHSSSDCSPTQTSSQASTRQEQETSGSILDAKAKDAAHTAQCEVNQDHLINNHAPQQLRGKSNSSKNDMERWSIPQYHKPGPIHLPDHATMSKPTSGPAARPQSPVPTRYVEHLRESLATGSTVMPKHPRMSSPPPVATRFPTLAQFESSHDYTSMTPSFPQLPEWEPLVPQSASRTSQENIDGTKPQIMSSLGDSSNLKSGLGPGPLRSATEGLPSLDNPNASEHKSQAMKEYEMQLALLEKQHERRRQFAKSELERGASTVPVTFPSPKTHKIDDGNSVAPTSTFSYLSRQQADEAVSRDSHPSSTARLVEPFDPLEAEPSAQPELTEGIRRNATVAGTSSRHNAPRRRPYSEAYDGNRRLRWDSFVGGPLQYPPGNQGQAVSYSSIVDAHQSWQQPEERATLYSTKPRMPIPAVQRTTEPNVQGEKIDNCVKQLRALGYSDETTGYGGRLSIYAQAASGDLNEAIEMIEDEQRAYDEGF